MKLVLRGAIAGVATGALLLLSPLAVTSLAQAQDTNQAAPAMGEPSDDQLRSFAAATLEVDRLNEQWAQRVADAEEANRKQALRAEAMQEMAEAVRDEGLTVSEYNAIVEVVQADATVAETVEDYRREMGR